MIRPLEFLTRRYLAGVFNRNWGGGLCLMFLWPLQIVLSPRPVARNNEANNCGRRPYRQTSGMHGRPPLGFFSNLKGIDAVFVPRPRSSLLVREFFSVLATVRLPTLL